MRVNNVERVYSPLLHQLRNQELGVFSLSKCSQFSFQLSCDHPPLFHGRVFDRGLNYTGRIVLENEVLHSASDDFKKLLDEFLSLVFLDMRFQSELLPQFLRALDNVGIRLRGFSFFDKRFLLCVRFSRVVC